jgi:threonyl-tRNA synthetase
MIVIVDGKKIEIEKNSKAIDLAQKLKKTAPEDAVGIKINNNLVDFDTILKDGDTIVFLNFDDKDGKDIFWHSSAHILAQAVKRLFPEAKPTIGPSIEKGFYYDFANLQIGEEDLNKIEKEIKKIISENLKPIRKEYKNKKEAIEEFSKNEFKCEMINEFDDGIISSYVQGEFVDLCRGPHLSNLGKIKALKLTKTSGAYWRADAKNEMLTRIYGISFPNKEMLNEYLTMIEEAKKRDHKILGQKLDLFSLKEEAPGMPFIHPKGMYMWEKLIDFLRSFLKKANYIEIKTPQIMTKELWERSGHWFHYKENMYTTEVEEREFAIKPMNCPGCMIYYKSNVHSYKEFPLKIAEIGHVHRFEPSGALNGLFRVRAFHQDDAHIFMKPSQIKDAILEAIDIADKIYQTFGLTYKLELSTRPEKSKTIGTDEEWENATKGLKNALDDWGHNYKINEGDGAFYGPKIDIHIKDALGRYWQCGTIQLDMSLPEKFNLTYVDSDNDHKRPVMIHRALLGSIERFYGILIEHFSGNFPLWISPRAVRLIPVADRHVDFANELKKEIDCLDIPCDVDDSNESVSKKIRNAQLLKVNYMLTIGDKELENKTINLRTRDNIVHGEMKLNKFLEKVSLEKKEKALISPFRSS